MLVNKLKWISSKKASGKILSDLDKKMADFYGKMASRNAYQEMIDEAHSSDGDPVNLLTNNMVNYILGKNFSNVLEIGCGSGKIFNQLKKNGFGGNYTGIEMAAPVIENNKINLPEATWITESVYDYCTNQQSFDCCIAFFVLEHLIYPEKALNKMLGTLMPGGQLLLVFPDFSHSGIFPSQKVGIHYGLGSKEKLKRFKIADAFFSYLEGRILAYRLREVNHQFGQFVVNINPYCLSNDCTTLTPDVDAIYISNRKEIENWAVDLGCKVDYPFGYSADMAFNPFISITKQS